MKEPKVDSAYKVLAVLVGGVVAMTGIILVLSHFI